MGSVGDPMNLKCQWSGIGILSITTIKQDIKNPAPKERGFFYAGHFLNRIFNTVV